MQGRGQGGRSAAEDCLKCQRCARGEMRWEDPPQSQRGQKRGQAAPLISESGPGIPAGRISSPLVPTLGHPHSALCLVPASEMTTIAV